MTQTPREQKDMELCTNITSMAGKGEYIRMSVHWLQEAKVYKQSYEGTLKEYEAEKARADIAESREQRLKEAAVKVEEIYESDIHDDDALNIINDMFKELLSTLYPDTPVPKEGEHE